MASSPRSHSCINVPKEISGLILRRFANFSLVSATSVGLFLPQGCQGCPGKTTKLIKEASKTGAIIVTENESKADNVRIMAEKMHLQIRPPISWNKYVTFYRFFEKNSPYVFDDISSIVRDELFSLLISNLPSSGEASSAAQIFDIEAMNSSLENVDFVDMSGKKLSVKIVVGYKRQEEDLFHQELHESY
jgi:hypothetical protein